ncbi:hypothetical protein DTO280E4_121 [Paecilomyces variotii]|nr:hypothetical protein DTO207G8_1773 [Paecilomyces variotii]KAJ9262272.1 hypothetical protein DTO195F2_3659 [Paecilomyces variotii]KAJ9365825.1 hypothetical protein DTO280E4_121 [Paecilomyces variotii]KAJ9369690.1 hypothetical protein DTO282E5_5663 [Paecilomyces variotii]KAJ9378332.1 hypothetical protein DTO063F5_7708 [Paecilomyces variotii]
MSWIGPANYFCIRREKVENIFLTEILSNNSCRFIAVTDNSPPRKDLNTPQISGADIRDLAFLFNIVPVTVSEHASEQRKGLVSAQYWYPPLDQDQFVRIDSQSTGWCSWSARTGVQEQVIPNDPGRNDEVYTVFFNQENDHFLVVPIDCSRESLRQRVDAEPNWPTVGWFRVNFKHLHDGRMSKLTHEPMDCYHLGARGSPEWVPQLLPFAYDQSESDFVTGLTGKLSLLVAMAAFTSEFRREHFITTMRDHFQPPRWIPRPAGTPPVKTWPRSHQMGVIVRIRPDPRSGIGRTELSRFEEGDFGCLIGN